MGRASGGILRLARRAPLGDGAVAPFRQRWPAVGNEPTATVRIDDVRAFVLRALTALHVADAVATDVADVFARATARAVGHHDVADLHRRLEWLANGTVDPAAEPTVQHQFGAVSALDGGNALGEICTSRALDVAMHSAKAYGIGLAVVSRSNHFLAAAPYAQRAAEAGMVAIVASRTLPSMGTPGAGQMVIGNNPLGFGVPVADGPDLIADMCWSYASWSSFEALGRDGKQIPQHWATDSGGRPTSDPLAALGGGPEPIGGHKGVAMALLVEVLASGLSDGAIADEIIRDDQLSGLHSQVALAIDPSATVGLERLATRTSDLLARTSELAPSPFRYPGQRSAAAGEATRTEGVAVTLDVLDRLDEWATRLQIEPIGRG